MNRLRRFFATHKTFVISIGFLVAFSVTVARATPPTSPYTAGQTLDPQCAPGDTNCTVQVSPWTLNGSYLYSGYQSVAIGAVANAGYNNYVQGLGYGLYFDNPSINTDPLSINRYNISSDISSLRVTIGDNGANPTTADYFDVGSVWSTDSTWHSAFLVRSDGLASIGQSTISAVLALATPSYAATSWGTNGIDLSVLPSTFTNISGASTIPNTAINAFGSPTLVSTSNGTVYTNASTLYIAGAPQAGTNTTITNPLALQVASGNTFFGGNVGIGTSNPTSLLTISGAGTTMTVGGNANFLNSVSVAGTLERAATIASWPNPGIGIFGNGTGTITDSMTAPNTTLPNANVGFFAIDTLAAANPGVTYTNASSLYIAGAPVAGTNVSIGNPYALYVAAGESFFGGDITASYIGGTNGLGTSGSASTITNFFASGGTTISGTTANATLQFAGSSNIQSRVDFGGSNGGGLSVNSNYSNVIVGSAPISTPGAGVNALLANLVVNPIGTITAGGGGSITNTATLYIGGAATAPVTGANYALDVASGLSQFGSTSVTTGTTVAQFQNAGGTCDITPNMTGGVTCSSDMNLKKNITNLSDNSPWSFNNNITLDNQDILTKILALNPVDYNWNVEPNGAQKHAGFIAQEVQQVFPDLVSANPQTGILSLDYTGLVPYTVEALQEMNFNITNIDDLTKTDSWRDAIEQWLADSANGIQSIFSQQVVTPSLCVGTNGDMTCITKAQLDQLLSNQSGTTTVTSAPVITSSTSSTPPSDNDNASQTPDVTAPVVTPPDQNQSTDTAGQDTTTGLN